MYALLLNAREKFCAIFAAISTYKLNFLRSIYLLGEFDIFKRNNVEAHQPTKAKPNSPNEHGTMFKYVVCHVCI